MLLHYNTKIKCTSRNIHTIDPSILSEQIRDSFRHFPTGNDPEMLNTFYEETLNEILNKIAPQSTKLSCANQEHNGTLRMLPR